MNHLRLPILYSLPGHPHPMNPPSIIASSMSSNPPPRRPATSGSASDGVGASLLQGLIYASAVRLCSSIGIQRFCCFGHSGTGMCMKVPLPPGPTSTGKLYYPLRDLICSRALLAFFYEISINHVKHLIREAPLDEVDDVKSIAEQ